jgi:hypothetical protein
MSSSAATRSSARLGSTLRAVLLTPARGFEAAVRAADRRQKEARRPAEGVMPYLLAAVGGATLLILWLKIGALAGLREAPVESYKNEYLTAALAVGAAVGLLGQWLWGLFGARTLGAPRATARNLRLVWGAAAFPQLATLIVLLPLDLLIVGPEAFTSDRLRDPLATAWAALSIALGVAFAVWAAYLFVRGVAVISAGRSRTIAAVLVALLLMCALFAPLVFSARFTQ